MSEYHPIACGLHENYQYAVLRRAWLDLTWRSAQGEETRGRLLPLDVYTGQGAEYLKARAEDGTLYEIRLDRIQQACWAEGGQSLEP